MREDERRGQAKTLALLDLLCPFKFAQGQRKRDRHHQVDQRDDIVGLEVPEGAGSVDLAQLGDIRDTQNRDQRTVLDQGDEIIAEGRQDGLQRLRGR